MDTVERGVKMNGHHGNNDALYLSHSALKLVNYFLLQFNMERKLRSNDVRNDFRVLLPPSIFHRTCE